MYKGRYIAVWLMAKEQRERRGDKEKEGERSKIKLSDSGLCKYTSLKVWTSS